jgi:hypothetical protein
VISSLFTEYPRIGILRSSPFGHSQKFAPRNSHLAYNLACLGIEKNGHMTYRLDASELLGSFASAGAAASR